jgi:hypothetical protein
MKGRKVLAIVEKKQADDVEELREIEDILIGSSHPDVEPVTFRPTDDPLPCTSAALARQTGPLH